MTKTNITTKKIVVFTGAGISAPSGLATFRDPEGIWSRYKIEEVATPEAWTTNPEKVLEFYNLRRAQLAKAEPNAGHLAIAHLEEFFDVTVITQNVDNLHERAGSSHVLHLHGELSKARSTYDVAGVEVNIGDHCPHGGQLRPHVVWFGEQILHTQKAIAHIRCCEILIVAGTSLTVYPAAGFIDFVPDNAEKYLVDPNAITVPKGFTHLCGSADDKLPKLVHTLLNA